MTLDYELTCIKDMWDTPANELVNLYNLMQVSDLFGELINISIEYKAHTRYENGQLTQNPIKHYKFDESNRHNITKIIETISSEYADHNYQIKSVWSVKRKYKGNEDVVRRFAFTYVGENFDYQPAERKQDFRMYLSVDDTKLYSPKIKRKFAIANMESLISELSEIMTLGCNHIVGLSPEARKLVIEDSNLIFVRDMIEFSKLLEIEFRDDLEDLIHEVIDTTTEVNYITMASGCVVYCTNGPFAQLQQFIRKLKLLVKNK